ncbi:hypothetical protein D3C85_1847430 [compost metagenome]
MACKVGIGHFGSLNLHSGRILLAEVHFFNLESQRSPRPILHIHPTVGRWAEGQIPIGPGCPREGPRGCGE